MKALLAVLLGSWLIINLIGAFIVGAIAKAILPGKENLGWFKTILLGFLGGILGRLLFALFGWTTGFLMGFIASVLGAFILLVLYQTFVVKKAGPVAPPPPAG